MKPETQISDISKTESLVKRVLGGEVNAFEELILLHKRSVATFVSRRIPGAHYEDLMQEIFIKAFRNLGSWSGRKPFRNWLSGIAARTCCDFWRHEYATKRKLTISLNADHLDWAEKVMEMQSQVKHLDEVENREARDILGNCLVLLKPDDRMVITMTYFEGYSTAETAEILGISSYNVKIKTFRARKKMQKYLSGILKEAKDEKE